MNTEINCKECIHYEICRLFEVNTDKQKSCDCFKSKNKYFDIEDVIAFIKSSLEAENN